MGRRFRMVLCSVLGRALELAGHLREKDAMHDVCNVRACGDELREMIEPHRCAVPSKQDVEGADMLMIKGLGCECRPGFSVVNSEYIAYHPYQCLPKYEITYEVEAPDRFASTLRTRSSAALLLHACSRSHRVGMQFPLRGPQTTTAPKPPHYVQCTAVESWRGTLPTS